MEAFFRSLALCEGIHWSPVDSPHKGQGRGAFDVYYDVHMNKRLNKHWLEMPVIWDAKTFIVTSLIFVSRWFLLHW